jgi:hypothetical protein
VQVFIKCSLALEYTPKPLSVSYDVIQALARTNTRASNFV